MIIATDSWQVGKVSALKGALSMPGDKSISHRAVILGALSTGTTRIDGWLAAEDCKSSLEIVRRLGAGVKFLNQKMTSLEVTGCGLGGLKPVDGAENPVLDCGNSGTSIRLMTGVLAAHPFRSTLTGDESLRKRPMKRVADPMRKMGATVTGPSDGATAPLEIQGGQLTGCDFDLPVPSAQVKSAILLAGLHARGITRVKEPSPSRDHTERALLRLGAKYWKDADGWHCVEGGQPFDARPIRVPGDISAAAFFLVAASIVSRAEVELLGVGINPLRAGILGVLERMGARITVTNEREVDGEPVADLLVKGGAGLKATRISGDVIPKLIDEIPVLAVAACFAEGVTVIRDAGELRAKESDRIATMAGELEKMGAKIGIFPDGMAIEGGAQMRGAAVESHGDHRVAMAMAVAGLAVSGETTVNDTANVATSYPGFYQDLKELCGVSRD
jgi:3-phosphoshikimate 1-carboxyvinyltransferase